jgi:uncharacterized membrane protein
VTGFAGRFHPLLVHFPIAFLLLAGGLELAAARAGTRWPWLAAARVPLLVIAACSAALAAAAGYLLGTSGGYGGATYDRHLQLGIAVAIGATLTAVGAWRRQWTGGGDAVVRIGLAVTLALLTAAGHLGATLTHGEGYLAEAAPAPIRDAAAALFGTSASAGHAGPAERAPVYPTLVRPILERRCVACHSSSTRRGGGLALDTPDGILAGGDHGAAVSPGRALASNVVLRVWLPPEHPDAMPPRPQRPLPPADAAILRWWIDAGAPFDRAVADVEIAPDVLPILEARLGPIVRGGPTLPDVALAAPDAAAIEALRAQGLDVRAVADGSPFLQVRIGGGSAGPGAPGADDGRVAALAPIAPHVLWLSLAGASLGEPGFAAIGRLPNVTRLDVSRTAADDAAIAALAAMPRLESLNLYATKVTDAGLARLGAMPRLRRVYLWQTAVTPAGVERLRAANPKLDVVLGEEPTPAAAATPGR